MGWEYPTPFFIGGVNMYLHNYFNNNKKRVISEYLAWEDFVERAQKNKTAYFYGIDVFLKEYKEAVYSCLKI